MGAKVAICIGDYSNGWNDAIIVQDFLPFKLGQVHNRREFTLETMNKALLGIINMLTGDEVINPKPKDETCCRQFEEWAVTINKDAKCILCPFCGTKITDERRNKFFIA